MPEDAGTEADDPTEFGFNLQAFMYGFNYLSTPVDI